MHGRQYSLVGEVQGKRCWALSAVALLHLLVLSTCDRGGDDDANDNCGWEDEPRLGENPINAWLPFWKGKGRAGTSILPPNCVRKVRVHDSFLLPLPLPPAWLQTAA